MVIVATNLLYFITSYVRRYEAGNIPEFLLRRSSAGGCFSRYCMYAKFLFPRREVIMTKLSAEERMRWKEIDAAVAKAKDELKAASSHEDLRSFAEQHGFFSKTDFPKFEV